MRVSFRLVWTLSDRKKMLEPWIAGLKKGKTYWLTKRPYRPPRPKLVVTLAPSTFAGLTKLSDEDWRKAREAAQAATAASKAQRSV